MVTRLIIGADMIGLCVADAIRRYAELRHGKPEVITRQWTKRPYLTRWLVEKVGDRGKVFLHHFQDSDADAMHLISANHLVECE